MYFQEFIKGTNKTKAPFSHHLIPSFNAAFFWLVPREVKCVCLSHLQAIGSGWEEDLSVPHAESSQQNAVMCVSRLVHPL